MMKIKALPNGDTRMVGRFRSMGGELLAFTEIIDSDACRMAFNAYDGSGVDDKVFPMFDDIFGRIGYTGSDQWRVYRHAVHHAARM